MNKSNFSAACDAMRGAANSSLAVSRLMAKKFSRPAILTPKGLQAWVKSVVSNGEITSYDELVKAIGLMQTVESAKEIEAKKEVFALIPMSAEKRKEVNASLEAFGKHIDECKKESQALIQSDTFKQYAEKSFSAAKEVATTKKGAKTAEVLA